MREPMASTCTVTGLPGACCWRVVEEPVERDPARSPGRPCAPPAAAHPHLVAGLEAAGDGRDHRGHLELHGRRPGRLLGPLGARPAQRTGETAVAGVQQARSARPAAASDSTRSTYALWAVIIATEASRAAAGSGQAPGSTWSRLSSSSTTPREA